VKRHTDRRFTSLDYSETHAEVFAARYDDGTQETKVGVVRRFLGHVRDKTILDLGCGIGYFASLCVDLGASVVACDFAESMVSCALERYGRKFLIVRSSAEEPPFASGRFDVVLALDVIEHLYHPEHMLRSVKRLLKPGGRLIITTDRTGFRIGSLPDYPLLLANRLLRKLGFAHRRSKYETPLCTHVCEYSVKELVDLVRAAGFRLGDHDTFPVRAAQSPYGQAVEFLARGPLKQYKWGFAIYEFLTS
jgi:2-polyprenyl-3-methyl-5-hydroxy-6-metoxy-1,4-benzoquinol methylase